MKKIIIILISAILGLIAFTGCSNTSGTESSTTTSKITDIEDSKAPDSSPETEVDYFVEMTTEEKNFLKNKYIDTERIDEGKLYNYQKEALAQYRATTNYIETKFPNEDFGYIALIAIDETSNGIGELMFYVCGADDDESYSIFITRADSGYELKDNYTNTYYSDKYTEYLSRKLDSLIEDNYRVYAFVQDSFGAEYTSDLSAEDVFALKEMKSIYIYIDKQIENEDSSSELTAKIDSFLLENNQYCSCIIYYSEGVLSQTTLVDCRNYFLADKYGVSVTLNTFGRLEGNKEY